MQETEAGRSMEGAMLPTRACSTPSLILISDSYIHDFDDFIPISSMLMMSRYGSASSESV
jgi:hypothetical protein